MLAPKASQEAIEIYNKLKDGRDPAPRVISDNFFDIQVAGSPSATKNQVQASSSQATSTPAAAKPKVVVPTPAPIPKSTSTASQLQAKNVTPQSTAAASPSASDSTKRSSRGLNRFLHRGDPNEPKKNVIKNFFINLNK